MMSLQVDPFIYNMMTQFPTSFVGQCIPNFWHWFGFITDFCIIFPNHKPCINSRITTSSELIFNAVIPVQIGKFTCSIYSGRNGSKVHSSEVNDISQKFAPKQWVSEYFSISVDDAHRITLS